MDNIGIFGGSFDPVHLGHLLIAQAARDEVNLCRLFFVPAARSPFKPESEPAPAAERLCLLRLALAGRTWCEIDEQEIRRGGISYSIDTVRGYAQRFPDQRLFYLVGADHVSTLPKWRQAQELARLAEFLVIPRPYRPEASAAPADAAPLGAQASDESPPVPPPFRGRRLAGFPLGVSSSQIRARVKDGKPIDLLVPAVVAEAIRNKRLYL